MRGWERAFSLPFDQQYIILYLRPLKIKWGYPRILDKLDIFTGYDQKHLKL